MICLFVSFEVKSESDDLSGKNLLCKYRNPRPDRFYDSQMYENFGYSFISHKEVIVFYLPSNSLKLTKVRGTYKTNLTHIKFFFPGHKSVKNLQINLPRDTLKIEIPQHDIVHCWVPVGVPNDQDYPGPTLENYFKFMINNITNMLKRKQKI